MSSYTPRGAKQRAEKAYQDYLAHIDGCAQCREEADCEEGRRMRRALRTARAALENAAEPENPAPPPSAEDP
ncbi:hypothetical protein [Streptomyces sp. NPDC058308]|uniref:hypothetical protein n=1 Tax=Streptomyces sp. NPDC058308 TaxID=3346440 RepID=UPI0036E74ACD